MSIKDKAIAAYEASDLKKEDIEKNQTAVNCIKYILGKFGIEAEVESNVLELDGIRFYAAPTEDESGSDWLYWLWASQVCQQCGERLVLDVARFSNMKEFRCFEEISIEHFGRWLAKPHLCEFRAKKSDQKKIGF